MFNECNCFEPQSIKEFNPKLVSSKSISNRVLIIKYLCAQSFSINNLSDAEDTKALTKALQNFESESIINIGHAGTAMRFATAFLALKTKKEIIISGSERMQQRPIKILVEALRGLGADIEYIASEGYPPLKIKPAVLKGGKIKLPADISSQYISALLLIASSLSEGLEIEFEGIPVSLPYIEMTLSVMAEFGINYSFDNRIVKVDSQPYTAKNYIVENDWSAAAYWYLIVSLNKNAKAILPYLDQNSVQGDSAIAKLFEQFGVHSKFENGAVHIENTGISNIADFKYDFLEIPDQAQTFACLCAAKGISVQLNGLGTLRIKETDRIAGLINELKKFGVAAFAEGDSLKITASGLKRPLQSIATYDDHRMAMCFAPLASVCDMVEIEGCEVVKKSYPAYWNDMIKAGFGVKFEI